MKQLRELFARTSSRWLAIELILVTCACMWAFDPVLVNAYVTHQPMGYDPDQLVSMEVGSTMTTAVRLNADNYQNTIEQEQLLEKIRAMDDVQQAYPANGGTIGFDTSTGNGFFYNGGDSLLSDKYYFLPESKMFEVFGIQSLTPSVPTEELTKDCEWDKSIILSRTAAMTLFGTTDVAGRTIRGEESLYNQDIGDFESKIHDFRIRAVVEDVRTNVFDRDHDNVYLCKYSGPWNFYTIVRLRPGVDARRFMSERKREVERDLVTEHLYVRHMESGSETLGRQVESNWQGRQSRRNLLISAFFGVNLAFGVLGTLLMVCAAPSVLPSGASSGASSARRGCSPPSASCWAAPSISRLLPRKDSVMISWDTTSPSTTGSMTSAPSSSWSPSSCTLLYYVPCSSPPPSLRGASAGAR